MGSGLDVWGSVAVTLFGLVGVTLLTIMTPGRLLNVFRAGATYEGLAGFAASPSLLIEGYIEADPPLSLAEMYRSLALYMEQRWDELEVGLVRRLDVRFRIAALLLIAETVAWVMDLS